MNTSDIKILALKKRFVNLGSFRHIAYNVYSINETSFYVLSNKEADKLCESNIRSNFKSCLTDYLQFFIKYCRSNITMNDLEFFAFYGGYDQMFSWLKDEKLFIERLTKRLGRGNLISSTFQTERCVRVENGHFYLINEFLGDLHPDPMVEMAKEGCQYWDAKKLYVFCDWLEDQGRDDVSREIRKLLVDKSGEFYIYNV